MSTYQPQQPLEAVHLRCPLCHCAEFTTEEARSSTKWSWSNHKMVLKVCTNCRFVLHFYDDSALFGTD